MESKEYFEKVMQDYNQNRNGRSLRKYCKDEAIDYDWLLSSRKHIRQEAVSHPAYRTQDFSLSLYQNPLGYTLFGKLRHLS